MKGTQWHKWNARKDGEGKGGANDKGFEDTDNERKREWKEMTGETKKGLRLDLAGFLLPFGLKGWFLRSRAFSCILPID